MPYTTVRLESPFVVKTSTSTGYSRDEVGVRATHGKRSYMRSGTNNAQAMKLAASYRSANATYVWVPTLIRKGPKLLGYQWSRRLKKMVPKRAVSSVSWRLKKVKSTSLRKPLKGLKLPPNRLSFIQHSTAFFPDSMTQYKRVSDNRIDVYQGDLSQAFRPVGSGVAVGVNVGVWTFSDLSSQLVSLTTEANNEATARFYEKVKNQKVNLAQALAERKQLSDMFLQLVKKLFKVWIKVKAGRLVAAAGELFPDSAKDLANIHLMYRYGVKPLINDLQGIVQALATNQDVYYEIVATRKLKSPRIQTYNVYKNTGGTTNRTTVTTFGEVQVKYHARVSIDSGYDSLVTSMARLGFDNPNSLAYEVIPFSFVVDWFIPIGNYLNNLDAFEGLTVRSITKTVVSKQYHEFERKFYDEPLDASFRCILPGTGGFVAERVEVQRTILSSLPSLPYPDFTDINKNIKRNWFTALALLVQMKR